MNVKDLRRDIVLCLSGMGVETLYILCLVALGALTALGMLLLFG